MQQYFSSADGKAFTGPFQLQKTFINGTLRSGGTGRSSHHVSKGLERTSLQQYFSSCAFSPPTRQRLRGRSTCRRHSSIINGTLRGCRKEFPRCLQRPRSIERTSLQQFFLPCAFSPPTRQRFGAFQVQKTFINGTLRYGVRKGASSFDFVDFCSSPSRQGYRKGPPRLSSLISAVLNYFAYGKVVARLSRHGFLVRDIDVYLVALAQSRPLTGSRVNEVSTKCRKSVDHVYSGTLSSTVYTNSRAILVSQNWNIEYQYGKTSDRKPFQSAPNTNNEKFESTHKVSRRALVKFCADFQFSFPASCGYKVLNIHPKFLTS